MCAEEWKQAVDKRKNKVRKKTEGEERDGEKREEGEDGERKKNEEGEEG